MPEASPDRPELGPKGCGGEGAAVWWELSSFIPRPLCPHPPSGESEAGSSPSLSLQVTTGATARFAHLGSLCAGAPPPPDLMAQIEQPPDTWKLHMSGRTEQPAGLPCPSHPSAPALGGSLGARGGSRGLRLTICGSWMSARLEMRAWLSPASSFSRLSLFCSISLFSSSMLFKLLSMDVI